MADSTLEGGTIDAAGALSLTDIMYLEQGSTGSRVAKFVTIATLLAGLLGSSGLTGATVTTSTPLINQTQTWNAAATFDGWKLNVTPTAHNAASQLVNIQTAGVQRLGLRAPHIALGTDVTPFLNLADVWNTSGNITGIKYNVTDTASAAGSLLMDLQVGGVSQVSVRKDGKMGVAGSAVSASFGVNVGGQGVNSGNYAISTASGSFYWSDLFLTRKAAANLRLGAADAAAPVAQTLSVQGVVAGTANTAGANLTIQGSQSTGSAAGGSIIFQVSPLGGAGSAQNAFATAFQIDADSLVRIGAHSAIAAETVTGYITIKDLAGNTRKVAVVS